MSMSDEDKTKAQLIAELREVRTRLADSTSAASPPQDAPGADRLDPRHRGVVEDQRLICRWRPDGTLSLVNDASCPYFGKRRDDLIGGSFLPLVVEADRTRVLEHARALGPHNPAGMLEHRVTGPLGDIRWHVRVNLVLLDERDQPAEFETVARDITEQQLMRGKLPDVKRASSPSSSVRRRAFWRSIERGGSSSRTLGRTRCSATREERS